MLRASRGWKEDRGQSLVEFALVVPILLTFILGVIDGGRIIGAYQVVSQGARDGARYASIGDSDADIQQQVKADTSSMNGTPTITISPASPRYSGNPVTVTVSYPVQIVDPIMAAIFGSTYTVTASVTMRME